MTTQTKPTHTPGPWSLEGPEHFGVRDQYRATYQHPTLGTRYVWPEPISITEPDARLIAAAPALLEALRKVFFSSYIQCLPGCKTLDANGPCSCGAEAIENTMAAAIRAAEGE